MKLSEFVEMLKALKSGDITWATLLGGGTVLAIWWTLMAVLGAAVFGFLARAVVPVFCWAYGGCSALL